jgi:CsoR family transcriptional regulator, copper-sensing transcriptional repressor
VRNDNIINRFEFLEKTKSVPFTYLAGVWYFNGGGEWMENKELYNESEEVAHCRKSHHPEAVKKDLTTRLNRIEGQIRGIKGMIEKDVYCDDVITQLSATQSALNSVAKILLEGHLKGCVVDRLNEGDHEVIDELVVTIQKLMKK